jgi:hypothetical protein
LTLNCKKILKIINNTNFSEISTSYLRRKLFAYLASALIALVLYLSISISFILLNQFKKSENNNLTHSSEILSMGITQWSLMAKDLARQITSRTMIRKELEKYNKNEISLEQLSSFTSPILQDGMKLSDEIIGIVRLDNKNLIVANCGYGDFLSKDIKNIPDYISSDVSLSKPLLIKDILSIIVSAPIISPNGARQGTDLVIVNLNLLTKIVNNYKKLSATSRVFIGYQHGDTILPLIPSQNLSKTEESNFLNIIKDSVLKAIKGQSGLAHTADMALAFKKIEESKWGLVITETQRELYLPVYKKLALIAILSLTLYITILLGFWFLMKPLAGKILLHTNDLEKKIKEKTEILEKEILERKKAEHEKEETIIELKIAMLNIKTLSGLLPICASCKKIRDDNGYWRQIEKYVTEHSQVAFSHGLCPACSDKIYGNEKWYIKMKQEEEAQKKTNLHDNNWLF